MFNVSVRKIVVSAVAIAAPVAFSFGASTEAWGGHTTGWSGHPDNNATTGWSKAHSTTLATTGWSKATTGWSSKSTTGWS